MSSFLLVSRKVESILDTDAKLFNETLFMKPKKLENFLKIQKGRRGKAE